MILVEINGNRGKPALILLNWKERPALENHYSALDLNDVCKTFHKPKVLSCISISGNF
jgi:hypothetical protein